MIDLYRLINQNLYLVWRIVLPLLGFYDKFLFIFYYPALIFKLDIARNKKSFTKRGSVSL
jgi:hypothetical protein